MVAATNSCSKDFLDEESGHMVTDGLLETPDGALSVAAGLYANIRWHFGYEWAYGITLYGCDEFTSANDLTAEPWNSYDNRLSPLDCTTALGAANNNCPPVSGLWDEMYYGLSTANLVISKADLIADEGTRKKVKGEGHFLRGYNYYRLFAQYGAVVLQTKPVDGVVKYFNRATEEQVLDQIISDFRTAYNILPTEKWRGNGTWTRYTAGHFLAKALLYRQSERCASWNKHDKAADLDSAIIVCREIIKECPLASKYEDLYGNWTGTDCKNEGLQEILMAAEHNADSSTKGRYGNRTYNYFNPQFSNFSGGWVQRGQYIGGMDFQRCRPTEYTYSIFDNVNDARMWKSFRTIYGLNAQAQTAEAAAKANGVDVSKIPVLNAADFNAENTGAQCKGIMFILNKKDYNDFKANGTLGKAGTPHTFIDPETGKWVPNVFAVYEDGKYSMDTYNLTPATCNIFCGINKTDDGSRTAEKGDATRDVIMARTGETYLVLAECLVRKGDNDAALKIINELRDRGTWKAGENRETYVGGDEAFKTNSTASATTVKKNKDAKGNTLNNLQAWYASYVKKNTYYISTGIPKTTEASSLKIESWDELPAEDMAVLNKLGVSPSTLEGKLHFIMNERTRELLGEWNRWDELSRTNLLIKRAKAFNAQAAPNIQEKHNLRPIPQKFIDGLLNEDGSSLTDKQKSEWQNKGW